MGKTGTEQLETVLITCPRSLMTHLDIFFIIAQIVKACFSW